MSTRIAASPDAGKRRSPRHAVVPLHQAADVHTRLENGTLRGKVLLQL